MAIAPAAEAAYENPLIPNAKLRQIFAAMARARLLGQALAKGRRRDESTLGLEACLASTSVDLGPGDFGSDAVMGGTVDFLRGKAFRYPVGGTTKVLCDATFESVLQPGRNIGRRGLKADCGAPSRLPAAPGVEARLWAAMGAALALKSQHAYERAHARANAASECGVVMAYARPGEVSQAIWRRTLAFAAEQLLPVLFVVLPATQRGSGVTRIGATCSLAHRHHIPGMAVDMDDAVALYRVAQEAIGRARIGGGAALMECVPFVLEGAKRASADAIAALEQYMLGRGVATRQWMERKARLCARRIAP